VTFTRVQWVVMAAICAMFAGMVLDILDVIDPANWVWAVVSTSLLLASWVVLPSMAELGARARHGGRRP